MSLSTRPKYQVKKLLRIRNIGGKVQKTDSFYYDTNCKRDADFLSHIVCKTLQQKTNIYVW